MAAAWARHDTGNTTYGGFCSSGPNGDGAADADFFNIAHYIGIGSARLSRVRIHYVRSCRFICRQAHLRAIFGFGAAQPPIRFCLHASAMSRAAVYVVCYQFIIYLRRPAHVRFFEIVIRCESREAMRAARCDTRRRAGQAPPGRKTQWPLFHSASGDFSPQWASRPHFKIASQVSIYRHEISVARLQAPPILPGAGMPMAGMFSPPH